MQSCCSLGAAETQTLCHQFQKHSHREVPVHPDKCPRCVYCVFGGLLARSQDHQSETKMLPRCQSLRVLLGRLQHTNATETSVNFHTMFVCTSKDLWIRLGDKANNRQMFVPGTQTASTSSVKAGKMLNVCMSNCGSPATVDKYDSLT